MTSFANREFVSLRRLDAWLVVVEERSITAAARRLFISQPALSQQIRALERQLGGELLERLPQGVKPTPLGRALLADARGALASAERLRRQAESFNGIEAGELEIATLPSLVDATLLDAIRRWHDRYPNVAITLREYPQERELIESVATGVGDLAIGVKPVDWRGAIVSLGWEQFVVVVPPQDPVADSHGPVDLAQLADREWVLYERRNGLFDWVTTVCAHSGFQPREAVSTSQVQAAARLAMAGIGPALVPSDNVPPDLRHATRLLKPPAAWELSAYARNEIVGHAAAFIELIERESAFASSPPADALLLPR
jgi:DNA-binding transcriptional LysR family regulator